MTQISRDDVLRHASLSSIKLREDEVDGLQGDLQTILKYVEQLDELNTDGVVPAYQVTGLENVYRNDEVSQSEVSRDELLRLAADVHDSQIKVPKVL